MGLVAKAAGTLPAGPLHKSKNCAVGRHALVAAA